MRFFYKYINEYIMIIEIDYKANLFLYRRCNDNKVYGGVLPDELKIK